MRYVHFLAALSLACASTNALADVHLDFEGFADGEALAQAGGLTFSNAIVLTAGIGLNEFDFPPYSGSNVVGDDIGPLTISFAAPFATFGAYFTYAAPLHVEAFDGNGVLQATAASAFAANMALSGAAGSTPNEWLQVSGAGGVSKIVITGLQGGGSFVMDDLVVTSVPEPAGAAYLLVGLLSLCVAARHERARPA